jgi:hypothetical protein
MVLSGDIEVLVATKKRLSHLRGRIVADMSIVLYGF